MRNHDATLGFFQLFFHWKTVLRNALTLQHSSIADIRLDGNTILHKKNRNSCQLHLQNRDSEIDCRNIGEMLILLLYLICSNNNSNKKGSILNLFKVLRMTKILQLKPFIPAVCFE